MEHEYTVLIEQDEDGVSIATVPALRGCHTAGDTEAEAGEMARDAIQLYVDHLRATGQPIPRDVPKPVLDETALPIDSPSGR